MGAAGQHDAEANARVGVSLPAISIEPGPIRMELMALFKSKVGIAFLAAVSVACSAAAPGQFIGKTPNHALEKTPPVAYLYPEQVHLAAGKASEVALHFRVIAGMHINSHTPHDDFLIPTTFAVPSGEGVRLDATSYPTGTDFSLPSAPGMKLNVYSGEFVVQTHMIAGAGNHLIKGTLHFQACNMSQCLPPQTITAAIDVIAK